MDHIFEANDFGSNVNEIIQTEDCRVMCLKDQCGEGIMTMYRVFSGVYLMYNDFHMKECFSGFTNKDRLLCIDHCREGRIDMEIGDGVYNYLENGDLRVDQRINHNGHVAFPLSHYHGLTIGFECEVAEKSLPLEMKGFSVKLNNLIEKYCTDTTPFVIKGNTVIEHIFSELYNVPFKIKKDYFRIKVLELLLFLDALEISKHKEERPYFYCNQVEKIKAIQRLMVSDLTKYHTIEELSNQFDIAQTPLKDCFKSVFGKPIFTYMRHYRMNYAASLLRCKKELKISEIAGVVGYDSPSKFSSAFHEIIGKSPLEYRKFSTNQHS